MIIKKTELQHVCGITSRFPETKLPEIAFAGKSNVGKSSLINSLLSRKALARTSSQPGKTQTINYYYVEGRPEKNRTGAEIPEPEVSERSRELFLVDLPGYGYTRASVEIREKWGRMIERYLHTSKELRAVLLLLDIRHAPGANDRQMYEWIRDQGFEPILIATKLDKIKRSQVQKQLKLLRETLGAEKQTRIVPFSSETKQGREELWEILLGICEKSERQH